MYEDCMPLMFRFRKEARQWAEKNYGYIKERKDLRVEPHGWKFPKPIKVKVIEVAK